jgi:hypothetical protein
MFADMLQIAEANPGIGANMDGLGEHTKHVVLPQVASEKSQGALVHYPPSAILGSFLTELVMDGLRPVLNPIESPPGLFLVMGSFYALLPSIGFLAGLS